MKIYLAPMEGLTTFVYRNALAKYYGGTDRYYSPFLANRSLSHKEKMDICPEHNQGLDLVPQVLTNHSDVFLEVAGQVKDYGYSEINLNLGCPSGTVAAKGRGAGFLAYPQELDRFLGEIFEKSPLDISIKTRIGIDQMYEWEDLLKIYAKYPIKELIIHPRLQKEFYTGIPHREFFTMAKEMLKVPLCYNGDIVDAESLRDLSQILTPEDNIMVGRGILRNPLLAAELTEKLRSDTWREDIKGDSKEKRAAADSKAVFRSFHNEILEGYTEQMSGDVPVLYRMKELWAYMAQFGGLSDKEAKQIRKCKSLKEYRSIVRL